MEFQWERTDEGWRLSGRRQVGKYEQADGSITIKNNRGLWTVYVIDAPVMPGNYTSEEAAKRDAWAFASRNKRAFFGAYRIKLEELDNPHNLVEDESWLNHAKRRAGAALRRTRERWARSG
jgi:hypothetical protein